jgi:hypothetical protein
MKLKHNLIIVLGLLAFTSLTISNTNDELIKKIITKFNTYLRQAPEEKVYLHFDKPYYMAGETMWFKSYLFDATLHGIDSVSRILYVDLIQPENGKILKHLALKCTSGTASGDIRLDEKLPEGIYTLRAYTQYMRNFSEDFFFKKEVKIWQKKENNAPNEGELKDLSLVADCQFFPESGNLVSGVLSRVGFKALNKLGRGIDVEGFILENDKDTLAFFKSEHLGMGMLSFNPKIGKTYAAVMKNKAGNVFSFPMPQVVEKGYVMLVDNISNKSNIKVFVNNSKPQAADKAGELVVIGQQRGIVCFTAKIPNTKAAVPLTISRQSVPDDGIVQITLFNTDGTPLCERLIFIKKQAQQFNLKVTADKAAYKPREKVTLTLEATDSLGQPVMGNFSLTATDSKQVTPPQYQENILSYLLLSSDLKGFIEDPAYYFKPNDFNATRHLDYLMMTQGWRRFTWKNIMADAKPRIDYPLEQGLAVTGKALRYNKKASSNAKMTLLLKPKNSKDPLLALGECDSSGRFAFYNLDFQDSCQMLLQAVKPKGGKGLDIVLDTIALPKTATALLAPAMLYYDPKAFAEFLKRSADALEYERQIRLKDDQMLNTLEVKAKRVAQSDSRRIYGKPMMGKSITISDADCITYRSVFDIIQQQTAGIQVSQNNGETVVTSRLGTLNFAVDGLVTDNTFIESLQPCDIEMVDVLRGADAAIFGTQANGGGIINILTKSGNPDYTGPSTQLTPGVITGWRIGYHITREFYTPQYDVSKPEHDLPDFRSTIFWHPLVKTDATGKATVSYWNSDAKTTVQIQVEGFSNKGRVAVGRLEYSIQ